MAVAKPGFCLLQGEWILGFMLTEGMTELLTNCLNTFSPQPRSSQIAKRLKEVYSTMVQSCVLRKSGIPAGILKQFFNYEESRNKGCVDGSTRTFARPSAVDEVGDIQSIETENFLTDGQQPLLVSEELLCRI